MFSCLRIVCMITLRKSKALPIHLLLTFISWLFLAKIYSLILESECACLVKNWQSVESWASLSLSFAHYLKYHFSHAIEKTSLVCLLFLFPLKEWFGFLSIACSLVFYFLHSHHQGVGPFWKVNKRFPFKSIFRFRKHWKSIVEIIEKETIENCYWCVICCNCILKEIVYRGSRLVRKNSLSLPYIGFIEWKLIYFILIYA